MCSWRWFAAVVAVAAVGCGGGSGGSVDGHSVDGHSVAVDGHRTRLGSLDAPDDSGGSGRGDRWRGWERTDPPGGVFTDVSAGEDATCGVRARGALECWGGLPYPLEGIFKQVSVSPGSSHACALGVDGSIACSGGSAVGWTDAPGGEFVDVSVGARNFWSAGSACGLRPGGAVQCWGAGSSRMDGEFSAVHAGDGHLCALETGGALVCWGGPPQRSVPDPPGGEFIEVSAASVGNNRHRPGADYVCGLRADGRVRCWAALFGDGFDFGQADAPEGSFAAVSAGPRHACALDAGGAAVCWGNREVHGAPPAVLRGPFTQISAGANNTCAVRAGEALVMCWGASIDGYGVLGGSFSEVAVGYLHACALRSTGKALCWFMGDGREGWHASSYQPAGDFRRISAGNHHSCGVGTDGAVTCWGSNDRGQSDAPSGEFVEVSAVGDSSCGLRVNGAVICWGAITGQRPPPGEFTAVSAAGPLGRPCGIRPSGAVECWGYGAYGEPPAWVGPLVDVSVREPVSCGIRTDASIACWHNRTKQDPHLRVDERVPDGEFVQVAVSDGGYCALRAEGSIACWSPYSSGGAYYDPYDSLMEPPAGEFTKLAAGARHACAIAADGTVACWGSPADPQYLPMPRDDEPSPADHDSTAWRRGWLLLAAAALVAAGAAALTAKHRRRRRPGPNDDHSEPDTAIDPEVARRALADLIGRTDSVATDAHDEQPQ